MDVIRGFNPAYFPFKSCVVLFKNLEAFVVHDLSHLQSRWESFLSKQTRVGPDIKTTLLRSPLTPGFHYKLVSLCFVVATGLVQ